MRRKENLGMQRRKSDYRDNWKLVKDIPVSLILALGMQTMGGVWWASNISTRMAVIERTLDRGSNDESRLVALEFKIEKLSYDLKEALNAGKEKR